MSSRRIPFLSLVTHSILLTIGGLSTVMAAEDSSDSVLVTATRTPTPESEILVPVLVITRADLERSLATDAADTLRFQAGLDIGRNGGPGQALPAGHGQQPHDRIDRRDPRESGHDRRRGAREHRRGVDRAH
jgi:outer membrane receptor protein involved in Fe transport